MKTRITQVFTKKIDRMSFSSQAYSDDGGLTWRWVSNDQYCPLEACNEYGIPCHVRKQVAARDAQLDAFFAQYRAMMAQRTQEEINEERAEARAAFGPGVETVNVITGERYRT